MRDFISLLIDWQRDKPSDSYARPRGSKDNVVLRAGVTTWFQAQRPNLSAFLQRNCLEQASRVMCIIRVQLGEREFWLAMFGYYKYLSHSHSSCRDPVFASVAMLNAPVRQKQFLADTATSNTYENSQTTLHFCLCIFTLITLLFMLQSIQKSVLPHRLSNIANFHLSSCTCEVFFPVKWRFIVVACSTQ